MCLIRPQILLKPDICTYLCRKKFLRSTFFLFIVAFLRRTTNAEQEAIRIIVNRVRKLQHILRIRFVDSLTDKPSIDLRTFIIEIIYGKSTVFQCLSHCYVFFVGSREQPLTHEHKAAVVNQSRGQRLLTAGLIGQSHTKSLSSSASSMRRMSWTSRLMLSRVWMNIRPYSTLRI